MSCNCEAPQNIPYNCCDDIYFPKTKFLFKASDIKIKDGKPILKRKYGKFTRQPVDIK